LIVSNELFLRTIQLNDIEKGIYFISLRTKNVFVSKKLIIN
jgi:hypothetical protein